MRGALFGSSLVLAASVSSLGCQDHGSGMATPVDADFYSCADEPRAAPYVKGMSVTSSAGAFTVKLLENTFTDPAGTHSEAPAKGVNVWTIEVQDAATAAPVDGISMAVTPRMPDHAHGTRAVGITSLGAGTYTLDPVYLYMAGFWQVSVEIHVPPAGSDGDAGAGASDTAVFPICISG
jgi:YtkA-like protein